MTPTEHSTKTPSATVGLFAVIGRVLRAGGSGAPGLSRLKRSIKSRPKQSVGSRAGRRVTRTLLPPTLLILLALTAALTAALALTPAPASALVFTGISFGPDGTSETAFQQPSAVGVDQTTGAIYVQDSAADTVQKFNSKHEPVAFNPLAPNVNLEGRLTGFAFNASQPMSQLAVNSTSHNFYVVNSGTETVRAYQSDGQPADFSALASNELGGFAGKKPCGVAVDGNGDVYVGVFSVGSGIHVYASSGEPLATIPSELGPCNVAVDSKGAVYVDYYPFSGHGVAKFTPSEFPVTKSTTYAEVGIVDANPGFGVAVDPVSNVLYVDEHTQVALFEEGGTLVETFPVPGSPGALTASEGLAVDSAAGEVYVSDAQGAKQVEVFGATVLVPRVAIEPASGVSETAMTLHGSVTPEGNTVTECFFEYGETTAYGHRAECEPVAASIPEAGTTAVSATVSGMAPARVRHFRLAAASASGAVRSGDRAIKRPAVLSESVSRVSNDGARLETEVSPQGLDTSYEFSYGPCGAGECTVPVPGADIGAGATSVPLSSPVSGLHSNTTYHYRVLARNALGQESGAEQTFTTNPTGEFQLPDSRQWQMVSPPQKQGSLFEPISERNVIQAAADGHAFTYVASTPTEAGPSGYTMESQVFSARGANGWQSRDLTVPHERSTGVPIGSPGEYHLFSRDLSQAAVQPWGHLISCSEGRVPPACMSPAASVQGAFLQDTSTGVLAPLLTGCLAGVECPLAVQENANEPPGVLSEPEVCGVPTSPCGVGVEGAAPDFAHVILSGLTEWSAGVHGFQQLRPVGLLPPNKEGKAVPAEGAHLGLVANPNGYDLRNAVSSDGSRVVFEASVESRVHLYMRVNALQPESRAEGERCTEPARACTVQVDAGLEGMPVFQTASDTGSRVFFTEVGGKDSGDLFVYEVGAAKPEPVPVVEKTGVVGTVLGASEDGSWVYFVSASKLAPGAVNGVCPEGFGVNGVCNLYVAHNGGGGWEAPRLVTVLSGLDSPDWAGTGRPAQFPDLQTLTARVSPDGRWLAFMSQRSLTGYDNRDLASGQPDEEVYEYHAPEHLESESGVLACASCNPTGERPRGIKPKISEPPLIDSDNVWAGEDFLAATIPAWTAFYLGDAAYQSRYLSDGGRLFFNAVDALVPKDTNGVTDVYEFEPQGLGSCAGSASSGSVVFKPARAFVSEAEGVRLAGVEPAGCVALLSSGSSAQESAFLDASESGSDVFFLTNSRLATADFDNALDVYDAHECTAESPCLPEPAAAPPACETEASCKAAPTPQPTIYQAPPSATFNGPGNVASAPAAVKPKPKPTKCKHGFVKKKVKKKQQCVKQKKPKHSSKRKGK